MSIPENDYEFEVFETITTKRKYIVRAVNADEAREKAEIGETLEEDDLNSGEVTDRLIVEGPKLLPPEDRSRPADEPSDDFPDADQPDTIEPGETPEPDEDEEGEEDTVDTRQKCGLCGFPMRSDGFGCTNACCSRTGIHPK